MSRKLPLLYSMFGLAGTGGEGDPFCIQGDTCIATLWIQHFMSPLYSWGLPTQSTIVCLPCNTEPSLLVCCCRYTTTTEISINLVVAVDTVGEGGFLSNSGPRPVLLHPVYQLAPVWRHQCSAQPATP